MASMQIQIRQMSGSSSEACMGKHRTWIDRPLEKGGTDRGPMGGQLFLASAGGCFMSNLLAAIRARESNVAGVEIEVNGALSEDAPARFVALELTVTAEAEDLQELEKLVEIADHGCIMMNTLRSTLQIRIRAASRVPVK